MVQAWKRFWYAPTNGLSMALFRIGAGLAFLFYSVEVGPLFTTYFGSRGLLTPARNEELFGPMTQLHLLPTLISDRPLLLAFGIFVAAAVALTLGFMTRIAALILLLGINSFSARDAIALPSSDVLLAVYALALVFAPANLPLSVEAWWRRRRGRPLPDAFSPWPQRLVQLQIAAVYLCAFLAKVQSPPWVDGVAVYYAHSTAIYWPVYPQIPLVNLEVVNLLTYGTLLVELAMATLVWFDRTRLAVLAIGVLLHLGFAWDLNLWSFSLTMVAAFPCFLKDGDLATLGYQYRSSTGSGQGTVSPVTESMQ